MQTQINNYTANCLCQRPASFGFSHREIEKNLSDKGFWEIVLMDLSKAFDTLNHKLLIAKLHAYSLTRDSFELINDHDHLSNR